MTAPTTTEQPLPTPPAEQPFRPGSITLDEFESVAKPPKEPDPFGGKSPKEILEEKERLTAALRLSEEARMRAIAEAAAAKAAAAVAPAPAAPVAPAAPPPKDYTFEELQEIAREDTGKAIAIGMEQTKRKLTEDLDRRFGTMANSAASTAEAQARQRYAEDFEVLGPEIKAFMDTVPAANRAAVWSDPKSWDTMIKLVRGENTDKLFEARQKRSEAAMVSRQREAAAAAAPPNINLPVAGAAPSGVHPGLTFDATTIDIMQKILGVEDSPAARAEWAKWHNAGRTM